MGPLGNSFKTKEPANYVLVAGGLGVPPLVHAAQHIAGVEGAVSTAVFGYRNVHFGDEYAGKYADKVYSIDESEGNVITLLDRIEDELLGWRAQAGDSDLRTSADDESRGRMGREA